MIGRFGGQKEGTYIPGGTRGRRTLRPVEEREEEEKKQKRRKRRSVRANESILSPFLFHGTCLSVTIARLLSTYRSLPLSVSRPAARPSNASSRSLLPLSFPRLALSFPFAPRFLARTRATSAFLFAPSRDGLGFRRKETTIRRIVATDHSWRVDRINGVRGFWARAGTPSRRVRCAHSRVPVLFYRVRN